MLSSRLGLKRLLIWSWWLTFGLAAVAAAEVVDRIVAVVNDEVITMSELEQACKAFQSRGGATPPKADKVFLRQTLEALIDQKLARAEAKRRGMTVSDKELEQALQDFRQRHQLPDDAAFAQALSQAGISLEELKQQITDQILEERLMTVMVGAKVKVEEGEVRHFYEREYPKAAGDLIHLRMITLPYPPGATLAQKEELQLKVESLLKEIRQGVSLEELRYQHNLTLQDLGFIPVTDLDPQLAGFLKGFRPGEIAPVNSPQGFQLVQVVGRKSGQPQSFEEVAPQIRHYLRNQAIRKHFAEWVKGLREKAHIKIML